MPDKNELMITRRGEISTEKFTKKVKSIDFGTQKPIQVYSVDLQVPTFTDIIQRSRNFVVVPSTDGLVSRVIDSPTADQRDYSRSSRFFGLHTDGQYLARVPEIAILHCIDPGEGTIPTVFADTTEILNRLAERDRLVEARQFEFVYQKKEGAEYTRPIIETHPAAGQPIMNIALASAECRLQPTAHSNRTQREANNFYDLLSEIAESSLHVVDHTWKKNDAVVFDNLRL